MQSGYLYMYVIFQRADKMPGRFNIKWKRKRGAPSYRSRVRGILHPEIDHPWHTHWQFTFIKAGAPQDGWVEDMDKTDLATVSRNRIRIAKNTVKCYARQNAIGVRVDMHLPHSVKRIIIAQYGAGIMCFAEENGTTVKTGELLKKDPFVD